MNVKEKVMTIIAKTIEVDVNLLDEDTAIGDFPGWDSMSQLVIISTIEDEFDIKLDPEDIMELEDVSDIIEIVEERLK